MTDDEARKSLNADFNRWFWEEVYPQSDIDQWQADLLRRIAETPAEKLDFRSYFPSRGKVDYTTLTWLSQQGPMQITGTLVKKIPADIVIMDDFCRKQIDIGGDPALNAATKAYSDRLHESFIECSQMVEWSEVGDSTTWLKTLDAGSYRIGDWERLQKTMTARVALEEFND